MEKIYIVSAHYSDWEWSGTTLIGAFDDEALARQARSDWEKTRNILMESEPPYEEDDWDTLTTKQKQKQLEYDTRFSNEQDFDHIDIVEHTLNEYIPWK